MDFGLWTSDYGLRTSDFRLWTLDIGFRTLDFGHWTSDNGLRTTDLGLQITDFVVLLGYQSGHNNDCIAQCSKSHFIYCSLWDKYEVKKAKARGRHMKNFLWNKRMKLHSWFSLIINSIKLFFVSKLCSMIVLNKMYRVGTNLQIF